MAPPRPSIPSFVCKMFAKESFPKKKKSPSFPWLCLSTQLREISRTFSGIFLALPVSEVLST
jgi:hypothetical protein